MNTVKMKYGAGAVEVPVPARNFLGVIEKNVPEGGPTEGQVVERALAAPIGTRPLREIVKPGQTVAIVVSDITRVWQRMSVYLPFLVRELNGAGIPDADIRFVCALGYHRPLTKEEHAKILGDELFRRFPMLDHDCENREANEFVGTTKRGTPVWINKAALRANHMVLTGACAYHPFVGWGGGKKSLVPGIAGFETIQANHRLVLADEIGGGQRPEVRNGNFEGNPVHEDMMEATAMVRPSFLFNVVMGYDGKIARAVAGAWDAAHAEACRIVEELYGVPIRERGDLVIASQGGFPKDIEFYQTGKAIYNAQEALKPGGTMIVLSECREGLGPGDARKIFTDFETARERETEVRTLFTVPKYVCCYMCAAAEKYDIVLVTSLDPALLRKTKFRAAKTVDEAIALASRGKGKDPKTWFMPLGSTVLPILHP